jgi:hypothetical protein
VELERSIGRGELEQLEGDESGDITVGGWMDEYATLHSWIRVLFVGRRVVGFPPVERR